MATSNGSRRTAPKGKATPPRNARTDERTLLTPTIQWILVAIAGLLVLGAIIYFGSDVVGGGGGGGGAIGRGEGTPARIVEHPDAAA